jgi:hypothetical protein
VDLGAITVSLTADLSGLDAGLRRAQDLIAGATDKLTQQENAFARALGMLGQSTDGMGRRWGAAWEAMDRAADVALERVTRRFGRSIARMIADGHGLRDFWRGLWRDLLEIAVQRLLEMVLRTRGAVGDMRDAFGAISGGLLGGAGGLIGGLLGGVFGSVGGVLEKVGSWFGFDNPRNDAWARKQGFDFGKHFRAGVAAATAMPATRASGASLPALTAAAPDAVAARFGAVTIAPGAFQVTVNTQALDERTVRDAGELLVDEVSRRLGWRERRSGVG